MRHERHDGRPAPARGPALPQEHCGVDPDDERDIDDPATSFGELLSCLRLAIGASQNALGREAGVNTSYINRLERGERTTPTREVVLALARALQATRQERDHLLMAAGYVPPALRQLGPADPTLAAVGRLLTNNRFPPESLAAFRAVVETIANCWDSSRDARPACDACANDIVGDEWTGKASCPRQPNALRGFRQRE